jgi:ferredoxin-NADP reductase
MVTIFTAIRGANSGTHEAAHMSPLWRVAEVVSGVPESESSRTIGLRVDGLNGNLPGQHIDIRLTADDGYTAVRSYSLATAGMDEIIEITVDELANGEVSPYLVRDLMVGDQLEIRGPVGGLVRLAANGHQPGSAHRRRIRHRAAYVHDPCARGVG